MLNALRLVDGFPAELFSARTGLPFTAVAPVLGRAEDQGLIERGPKLVRPSARGRRFLNELLQLFLADGTPGRAPGGRA
jgi:oxygen-independent coproporphyrinogen-3 oxidase